MFYHVIKATVIPPIKEKRQKILLYRKINLPHNNYIMTIILFDAESREEYNEPSIAPKNKHRQSYGPFFAWM